MKKLMLILLSLSVSYVFAQSGELTLEQCSAIALKNNPQIKIAEGTKELSTSSVVSTRSALMPQVGFSGGWTRNGGTNIVGKNQFSGNYETYATGFSAQQLIFDFGKSYSKLNAAAYSSDAANLDYETAKQSLLLSVHSAYYGYLQTQKLKEANAELVRQAEEHLAQAKGLFDVGKKPQFDVMKAQTDLANAKLNFITASNNVRLGKIQLENVLNQKLPDNAVIKDEFETSKPDITLQDAYESAINNRPEIMAGRNKVEASKSLLTSAWTANLPSINATGGYNWKTMDISQKFSPSWNLGLTLSLPIFQGFALDAGIDQARANLKISEGQNESVLQSVKLDIEQQYSNLEESRERIDAAKLLLSQAEETYRLADARYKEQVGSPIEITDAEVTLLNAKTSYIQAYYDFNLAYTRLSKAMGVLK